MKTKYFQLTLMVVSMLLFWSCKEEEPLPPLVSIDEYIEDNKLEGMIKTSSGLYYKIIEQGDGSIAQNGQIVSVDYTGSLLSGSVFDSSIGKAPFQFELGAREVISGWDEGIGYLKKGDKAILLIPSNLAYGSRANGPIPANSSLRFDVTLVDIQ